MSRPVAFTSEERKALVATTEGVVGAAKWFWWIAGLSLVNTVLIHGGSETSFVIGLGFTLLADVIFQEMKVIAFAIDALAIGFFVGMGVFALRGQLWAFLVGGIVYTLDAVIYLYLQDWLALGIHVLALFFIGRGFMALRAAYQEARLAPVEAVVAADGTPPVP